MPKLKNLTGISFGRLTVLRRVHNRRGRPHYACRCACGKTVVVLGASLTGLNTKSCGCLKLDVCATKTVYEYRRMSFGEAFSRRLAAQVQNDAKRRNLRVTVSPSEIIELRKQHCFYCGHPPVEPRHKCYGGFPVNGLDRLDNSKGYTVENCVPCCFQCNRAKRGHSAAEFIAHVFKIGQRFGVVTGEREPPNL